ncbi:MAG: hypothetical protein CMK02_15105 [Polycyclovorans sp.]|nr:hypothetical protein [Polycyclovorans sp.]
MSDTDEDRKGSTAAIGSADWEALSALADGELSPDEAVALRNRAAHEPALAEALTAIEGLRHDVRRWTDARKPRRGTFAGRIGLLTTGAVAASLVWVLLPNGPSPTPIETSPAMLTEAQISSAILGAPLLDLSQDDLTPVMLTTVGERAIREYVGPNGCRLTHVLATKQAEAMENGPEDAEQNHRWSVGSVEHALIAYGMDQDRFEALAAFAEAQSRAGRPDGLLIARAAGDAPCTA